MIKSWSIQHWLQTANKIPNLAALGRDYKNQIRYGSGSYRVTMATNDVGVIETHTGSIIWGNENDDASLHKIVVVYVLHNYKIATIVYSKTVQ